MPSGVPLLKPLFLAAANLAAPTFCTPRWLPGRVRQWPFDRSVVIAIFPIVFPYETCYGFCHAHETQRPAGRFGRGGFEIAGADGFLAWPRDGAVAAS